MVTLKEEIQIPVAFEKLNAWADNFQEEFVKWSPYHLECQVFDGLKEGGRIRFYEIVMGLDYDVSGKLIHCERDNDHFLFTFENDKRTALITFEGKRTENGCYFSHTEAFGMQTPIIGPIMNFLILKVIYRKKANWQIIRDDMILDNNYLKDILVNGKYPERIPVEELKKKSA